MRDLARGATLAAEDGVGVGWETAVARDRDAEGRRVRRRDIVDVSSDDQEKEVENPVKVTVK